MMQLSDNMRMVKELNDQDFFTWARFVRYADVPKWEEVLLYKMINDRLATHDLHMQWGCCGTNHLLKREEL